MSKRISPPKHRPTFLLHPLESRLLLSGETFTPASVLTRAMRQELLIHWNGSNKSDLSDVLGQGKLGAFDSRLLSYMVNRDSSGAGPHFYFQSSDADSIAS